MNWYSANHWGNVKKPLRKASLSAADDFHSDPTHTGGNKNAAIFQRLKI